MFYADSRQSGIFALTSVCMGLLQILWIVASTITTITLQEELARAEETGAESNRLLIQISLQALLAIMAGLTFLAWLIGACVAFRLREYLLQPALVIRSSSADLPGRISSGADFPARH